jgi:hypothetical protein
MQDCEGSLGAEKVIHDLCMFKLLVGFEDLDYDMSPKGQAA